MKFQIAVTTLAIALASILPARAQTPGDLQGDLQPAPTARQVLEACQAGRAPELLPNPYTDVSPSDWAYTAVINMYYCGAFRQATPDSLIDRLAGDTPQTLPDATQSEGVSEWMLLRPQ
ncbi:MAG: S-layer protein [Leptolyngbyaceae cyanobacterium SM1_3_5]|nr:S-layer protein [Leptolyngbyaceae cyanobacterium SM1_3_5]